MPLNKMRPIEGGQSSFNCNPIGRLNRDSKCDGLKLNGPIDRERGTVKTIVLTPN